MLRDRLSYTQAMMAQLDMPASALLSHGAAGCSSEDRHGGAAPGLHRGGVVERDPSVLLPLPLAAVLFRER